MTDAVTRLLTVGDAPALAELLTANRAFLTPWEPTREDSFFTAAGQDVRTRALLTAKGYGTALPLVILDDGEIAGCLTLSGITRGAFQSASLGYWVDAARNGRGLATAAVGEAVTRAFTDLGLHRVEAQTLPHNTASQRVLARNGFTEYGRAPSYLRIDGEWREHVLFQRIAEEA